MSKKTYRNLWKGIRIFGDCMAFLLSFFVVYFFREHFLIKNLLGNIQSASFYFFQLPFLLFILILIFKVYGLYDEVFYKNLVDRWKNEYFAIQKINSKLISMKPTGSKKEFAENLALFT
ncbi:MAG: hypothetical protein WCG28_04075, partial [bacterium]